MTLRILFVEDDEEINDLFLSHIRERWGPESASARSVERALDLVVREGFRPDLVIQDYGILERDADPCGSFEAGRRLYDRLSSLGLPIVLISGEDPQAILDVEPFRSRPPLAVLTKPSTYETIDRAVEIVMAAREATR